MKLFGLKLDKLFKKKRKLAGWIILAVLTVGLTVTVASVQQSQNARSRASHLVVTVSGRVYDTATGAGFGGIPIQTCSNGTIFTDGGGNFSFNTTDTDGNYSPSAPNAYCVRVVNPPSGYSGPQLNSDYPNPPEPSSSSTSYEYQLPGANCRNNTANCSDPYVRYDRNSDSGFDFVYTPPVSVTPTTPPSNSTLQIAVVGPSIAIVYSTEHTVGDCNSFVAGTTTGTDFSIPVTCNGFQFGPPNGLTLHAKPISGWTFKQWRVDQSPSTGTVNCNTTNPDGCIINYGNNQSAKVTAVYESATANDSTLKINVSGPSSGVFYSSRHTVGDCNTFVTGTTLGADFTVTGSRTCNGFQFGPPDGLFLHARAVSGYTFSKWRVDKQPPAPNGVGGIDCNASYDPSVPGSKIGNTCYIYYDIGAAEITAIYTLGSASPSPSPTTTPNAPSSPVLKVDSVNDTQVFLSWNLTADQYEIYRNNVIVAVGSVDGTYIDAGLSPCTTYTHKVVAIKYVNGIPIKSAPSKTVTTTTTGCVIPTPTRVPTPTPTTTIVPTATPVPSTSFAFNLLLHGLGVGGDSANSNGGGNTSPLRPARSVSVQVFNSANALILTKAGTVSYNSGSGSFKGTIGMGTDLSGSVYTIKVKTDQFLRALVPGIQTVPAGNASQTVNLPTAVLINGDVNNDNTLDILDYNILIGCYSDLTPAVSCTPANKILADLNDDGNVNQFDYNLFLRELVNRQGE